MKAIAFILFLLAGVAKCAASDYLVVPVDRTSAEGNDQLILGNPAGFKQVYTAQNFTGPVEVSGVAFRLDGAGAQGGEYGADLPRLTLTLSTYNGQRSVFTYNTPTANARTLFDNSVSWRTADRTDTNPNAFDFSATFTQPYLYDPSSGALVLQFVAPSFGGIPAFDMHGPASVALGWFSSPVTPVGGLAGIVVTRFEVTQVPEPEVSALLLTGLVGLAYQKWKGRWTK